MLRDMRRGVVLLLLALGTGTWLVLDLTRRPAGEVDRGVEGIEFVVPAGYTVLELGETVMKTAATRLLAALEAEDRVAVVFTDTGDRAQLLVDLTAQTLDERVLGRNGTVKSVLWSGAVRERLQWAEETGDLAAPGLPPPERRNPYH
jgi:hypothetical protein